MPAQKRSSYDEQGGGKRRASPQGEGDDVVTVSENGGESDRSPASGNGEEKRGDHKEYVMVNLSEIRKEVQCPICLGIIRRTRTMMECLHRFCRECIDKSMRLGNNECPACRTHCASRRSLRDDPNYDALIAALYPDIDKFEEEEFAFDEEEIARNKQIQASIGNAICRQAKGVKKRRRKATEFTKGKKKATLSTEIQGSDDNEDGKEIEEPSSADEHSAEARPKRIKRAGGTRSSSAHSDEDESDPEGNKEAIGPSCGLVVPSGKLTWGKNGVRSHARHGNTNGTRNTRVSKLVDYLKNSEEHDDELNLQIVLVSFDEASIPNLQRPYLGCRPSLSVKQLLQYVALHTASQADQLGLYLVKDSNSKFESSVSATTLFSAPGSIDPLKLKLQALEEHDTLSKFPLNNFLLGHLLLVYQKKRVEMEEVTVYKPSA